MSENDFKSSQGNQYRGSRYNNFSSGSVDANGNVTGVGQDPGLLDSSSGSGSAVSTGLTSVQNPSVPSAGKALTNAGISAAVPYATSQIGATAGAAIAGGATFGEGVKQGVSALGSKIGSAFSSGTAAAAPAAATGAAATGAAAGGAAGGAAGAAAAAPTSYGAGVASRATSGSAIGGAAGAGIGTAAATLLTGGSVKDAAKAGIGSAAGAYIGQTLIPIPGVGAVIGSVIGGALGGRVICTELVRQGLLTAADQRLDMDFTFRHLSNVHARGYLFWGRPYARRMRSRPLLTKATHKVVVWRLNEIKYQLGMRDKPDYLGKLARLTLEPMCYLIGLCLEDTAESRIYKKGVTA